MVALIIVCLVIIGFLGYKLYQKKTIDTQLADEYQNQVAQVKEELRVDKEALSSYQSKLLDIQVKVNTERQKLTDLYNQLDSAQTSLTDARTEYHNLVNERIQEIDQLMDEQRRRRQESLDETFNEKKSVFQAELQKTLEECDKQAEDAKKWMAEQIEEARKNYQRQVDGMRDFILSHTDIDVKTFNKNKKKDWYLTPEEVVKYNVGEIIHSFTDFYNIKTKE